jgi:hypothetical protein
MTIWKDFYLTTDSWTTWDHTIQQTQQLLTQGGQLVKVLVRNITGQPIGDAENPIIISTWEPDTTSGQARKRIWQGSDIIDDYPNPDSVRVFVDDVELHKTFSTVTIMNDNEFYVEVQDNLVGYDDNVSIYLNRGYNPSGHSIGYSYSTRAKSINDNTLHPISDTTNYRSLFGFTQYIDPAFTFRGLSYPNCTVISFPPPPPFDTKFLPLGSAEQWEGRAWTLGSPLVFHEFDIIYRVYDGRYYEVKNIEYNPIFYQFKWILLTQSFTLAEVSPTDVARQFPLT